jgi:RNA polymerase sigma-70 factor, ECF subfamily
MTLKLAGPPEPGNEPYQNIESLIRAAHAELGRVAFRFLGNKADAEDAVQSACIKVLRCWAKVAGFATAAQQRAYLVTAVTNEALQIRRRPHRRREVLTADDTDREPGWMPEFPGGNGQASSEFLRRVWQAIGELPEENREVLLLFGAGYEYCEIAEMLDITVSTVRSHVSSARRRLRRAAPSNWKEGLT